MNSQEIEMKMNKPKKVFLLAGGRNSSETLLTLLGIVFRENRMSSPTIAYVGTANGDDEGFFKRIAEPLRAAGANRVNHALISSDRADLEKAQDVLNSADIIFISGGDVYKGINMLKEKRIIGFMRRLYEEGKPFFGISAGSIMLAKNWVHWNNPDDDMTAELFPCLGFAPIICDTHGEQDDWEELKIALSLATDGQKGYGIVSGTAIKVYPDSNVEALGGAAHQFIRREGKVVRLPGILAAP